MRKDSGSGFVTPFQAAPCKCGLCRPTYVEPTVDERFDEHLRAERVVQENERDPWSGEHVGPRGWRP